jgi:type II secretory pathway pseudopilin PulG
MTIHATAWPEQLEVNPGETASFAVTVTNTSSVIDAYTVQVFGIDPAWVSTTPDRLSLFPGDVDSMTVNVNLPLDYPSSQRLLALNVRSENDPDDFALAHTEVSVIARSVVDVQIDPPMMQGGRKARFGIVINNTGNAPIVATPVGTDPEALAEFEFLPSTIEVPAGRSAVVQVTARKGRAWLGAPRARTFSLGAETDARTERPATFIQRPRIGRWLISLLGLLAAAAVFAAVLSRTFDSVVDEASVDERLLEEALKSDAAAGGAIPVNPGSATGLVTSLSTESGVPGIQAELFLADDPTVPIASAATDTDGKYTFGSLEGGTYKVRFTGAGFAPIWYESGLTAANATEIDVELGAETSLGDLVIGGLPGSVSGWVIADDPSGALASLVVQGQIDATTAALVSQVEVSADGSFIFEAVPSPADYTLRVEKLGFATETRALAIDAGQTLDDVEVSLRPDDGVIIGRVDSAEGALGGAMVVATDGSNTISTVSLTVDDNRGWFALRNLASPGRYTVTISREGFGTESRNVVIDSAGAPQLNVTLARAIGSMSGITSTNDRGPTGGVTVSVAGAAFASATSSISQQGTAGGFLIENIPIPGSYTVTFSKPGYVSQVLLVELDPRSGTANPSGVNVELVMETAVVRGTVFASSGTFAPQAKVKLSDGSTIFEVLSANDSAGTFEFTNIPVGAYTLSASLLGTRETVVPINLQPGGVRVENLTLGTQAAITGRVVEFVAFAEPDQFGELGELVPSPNRTVRLILLSNFPGPAILPATTDANGEFTFTPIEAGVAYVVAVYAEVASQPSDELDSLQVISQESQSVPLDRDLVFSGGG